MTARARSLHGAVIEAPAERGFLPGDEPRARNRPKARSEPPTASAWRGAFSALKLFLGVVAVISASLALGWGAYRYALTTPRFAVRELEIDGARRLGRDDLAKLAGIELGRNVFAFDVALAETRLLESPWIREVSVSRKLPNTLRIALVEQEPAALAAIGDQLYLVTRTGEPFKRLEPDAGDPHQLPLVTGIRPEALAKDRAGELERLRTALDVLRHYERLVLSKTHEPQEVHVESSGQVVLSVGRQGIALHLGRGPWQKKLTMAERVLSELARKGRVPGIVFLDNEAHPERVVVRMR
jgi:cell division protein FtsQ